MYELKECQEDLLVSIIVATHNRSTMITAAIDSLLTQTYGNLEIIIVDDASTDNTPEVVSTLLMKDHRINTFRSEKNIGPGAARNLGVSHANGQYIAIMDDDDSAYPNRIETQARFLDENPDVGLVFSSVDYVDENFEKIEVYPKSLTSGKFPKESKEIFKLIFTEYCHIPNTTIMMRKCFWEKFRYPEEFWIGEDWFLICQLAAKGVRMVGINRPLVQQYRASARIGLLNTDQKNHYKISIKLINQLSKWLKDEGFHGYESLVRSAKAYRFFLGSKVNSGLRGLALLLWGRVLDPSNSLGKKLWQQKRQSYLKKVFGSG